MKFESFSGKNHEKDTSNVIDMRTREPYQPERAAAEAERGRAEAPVHEQYAAILSVLSDTGLELQRQMGLRDQRKLDRLPDGEREALEEEFMQAAEGDSQAYFLLSFRKTFMEATKETRDLLAVGKISPETAAMRENASDHELMMHSHADEGNVGTLKAIFF